MADYLTTDTELTSVANAIRTKGGTSASLTYPAGFVSAINAIPTGGGGGNANRTLVCQNVYLSMLGGADSRRCFGVPFEFADEGDKTYDFVMLFDGLEDDLGNEIIMPRGSAVVEARFTVTATEGQYGWDVSTFGGVVFDEMNSDAFLYISPLYNFPMAVGTVSPEAKPTSVGFDDTVTQIETFCVDAATGETVPTVISLKPNTLCLSLYVTEY